MRVRLIQETAVGLPLELFEQKPITKSKEQKQCLSFLNCDHNLNPYNCKNLKKKNRKILENCLPFAQTASQLGLLKIFY
jgi:hypothetical protein